MITNSNTNTKQNIGNNNRNNIDNNDNNDSNDSNDNNVKMEQKQQQTAQPVSVKVRSLVQHHCKQDRLIDWWIH